MKNKTYYMYVLVPIMLACVLIPAVSGIPAYAANPIFYVSAENSESANLMSGPQVIEVIILDSGINSAGTIDPPDVTINGKKLTMTHTTADSWHAYFADRDQAQIADSTQPASSGVGLDFGRFCSNQGNYLGFSVSDTDGIALPTSAAGSVNGNPSGGPITADCGNELITETASNLAVIRHPLQIYHTTGGPDQIDISYKGLWPFIQLYSLPLGDSVTVKYNKTGQIQTVPLLFDTTERHALLTVDMINNFHTPEEQIQVIMSDLWLNIDPTDEDSWTWATGADGPGVYYRVFDKGSQITGDGSNPDQRSNNIYDVRHALMLDNNGVLSFDADPANTGTDTVLIQDNNNTAIIADGNTVSSARSLTPGGIFAENSQPITFTEHGRNSGVFVTHDGEQKSVLVVNNPVARDAYATMSYNDDNVIIVANYPSAQVDIRSSQTWNSGQEIPIHVTDPGANKNHAVVDILDLSDPADNIPSLKTGSPFTLGTFDGIEVAFFDSTIQLFTPPIQQNTRYSTGGKVLDYPAFRNFVTNQGGSSGSSVQVPGIGSASIAVDSSSDRALVSLAEPVSAKGMIIDLNTNMLALRNMMPDTHNTGGISRSFEGIQLLNHDIRSMLGASASVDIGLLINLNGDDIISMHPDGHATITAGTGDTNRPAMVMLTLADNVGPQGLTSLNGTDVAGALFTDNVPEQSRVGLVYYFEDSPLDIGTGKKPVATDIFSFGVYYDGGARYSKIADQIIRLELEETGPNTGDFAGTLEYAMVNMLNVADRSVYDIRPISDKATFIVMDGLLENDMVRVNYPTGSPGSTQQLSHDTQEIKFHDGTVLFDKDSYNVGDIVTVTIVDADLNLNNDIPDIYSAVDIADDPAVDSIGASGFLYSRHKFFFDSNPIRMVDIVLNDNYWIRHDATFNGLNCISAQQNAAPSVSLSPDGMFDSGFILKETGPATGMFEGKFKIPTHHCQRDRDGLVAGVIEPLTNAHLEIDYNDFTHRLYSDSIYRNIGLSQVQSRTSDDLIRLNRDVYPIPWGQIKNFDGIGSTPNGASIFPIHSTGITGTIDRAETLPYGKLFAYITTTNPAYTTAGGYGGVGGGLPDLIKITVSRGDDHIVLGYAGSTVQSGKILAGDHLDDSSMARHFGPFIETEPHSGIFNIGMTILYTDGPASPDCPDTAHYKMLGTSASVSDRFTVPVGSDDKFCILDGDVLGIEYALRTGDNFTTFYDSATFDLKTGVLKSDKSSYVPGTEMVVTLIEPDWNLGARSVGSFPIGTLQWEYDSVRGTLGDSEFRKDTIFKETGPNTGIFKATLTVPTKVKGHTLEPNSLFSFTYTDWGTSDGKYVGDTSTDVTLPLYIAGTGATVVLDKKLYSWTDKVHLTILSPNFNSDPNIVDQIGQDAAELVKISTGAASLDKCLLVETGADTGIFTGEILLTGFAHDADGDNSTGIGGIDTKPRTGNVAGSTLGFGTANCLLESGADDALTVSFEATAGRPTITTAPIRWGLGEVMWVDSSYPVTSTGVVRVTDSDMNLHPERADRIPIRVISDTDDEGVDIMATETGKATGIFEGAVKFTLSDESSGNKLRVSSGDLITARYGDYTPSSHPTAGPYEILPATSLVYAISPLERARASDLRILDSSGMLIYRASVDQEIVIATDLKSAPDHDQPYTYIVLVNDESGGVDHLKWISGTLRSGQTVVQSISWTPTASGTYDVQTFIWDSLASSLILSPSLNMKVTVN